jgi:hypothetical protein
MPRRPIFGMHRLIKQRIHREGSGSHAASRRLDPARVRHPPDARRDPLGGWVWKAVAILPGAGPAAWREQRREGDAVEYHAATVHLDLTAPTPKSAAAASPPARRRSASSCRRTATAPPFCARPPRPARRRTTSTAARRSSSSRRCPGARGADPITACARLTGDDTGLGRAVGALSAVAKSAKPKPVELEDNRLFIGIGRGELLPHASYCMTGFLNEKPLAVLRSDMARFHVARAGTVFEPRTTSRACWR